MPMKNGWNSPDFTKRLYWFAPDISINPSQRLIFLAAKNGLFASGKIAQDGVVFIRVEARLIPITSPYFPKGRMLSELQPFKTHSMLNAARIPLKLINQAKAFFYSVYEKYQSEAMLQLMYSHSKQEWLIRPLMQKVNRVRVQHQETEPLPTGFFPAGIIHSHADFSAGHSAIDDNAELPMDGIYITLGRVHESMVNISCSVVVKNMRFLVYPDMLIEPCYEKFPHNWLSYVSPLPPVIQQELKNDR